MSKKTKKKVVSTIKRPNPDKKRIAATVSKARAKANISSSSSRELLFGMETYKWMGIGVVVMALGYLMMLGGEMPDPNTWDENIIYSFRITVLAPFLILAGLGLNVYAIFKK